MVKMGRPLKFETPESLQNQIDLYFEQCTGEDGKFSTPPTVSGLAYFLDTSRETLMNYEMREDFFDAIKRAKARILAFNEEQLYRNTQVTGVIFNLKNNFGFADRQEIDHTTKGEEIKGFNYITPQHDTYNSTDS